MLSYRHAFHAGNHADVLKHWVYGLVLDYFNQKDKPYWVVDTHAGAGMYALHDAFAQKNKEFETGFARLLNAKDLPETLSAFKQRILSFNPTSELTVYPGSPLIAKSYLRESDKLRLFELHPSDFDLLSAEFVTARRQVNIEKQDGFFGIKACLPPPTKRGLVLIDPPYEVKEDYAHVVNCIKDSLKRFATGTYLIWYPLLQRSEPNEMIRGLKALGLDSWLDVSLTVQTPSADGFGMHGSGMFVVNPPWTLPKILEAEVPALTKLLAINDGANYALESAIK